MGCHSFTGQPQRCSPVPAARAVGRGGPPGLPAPRRVLALWQHAPAAAPAVGYVCALLQFRLPAQRSHGAQVGLQLWGGQRPAAPGLPRLGCISGSPHGGPALLERTPCTLPACPCIRLLPACSFWRTECTMTSRSSHCLQDELCSHSGGGGGLPGQAQPTHRWAHTVYCSWQYDADLSMLGCPGATSGPQLCPSVSARCLLMRSTAVLLEAP